MNIRSFLRLSAISVLWIFLFVLHAGCIVPAFAGEGAARCGAVPLENAAAVLNVPAADLVTSNHDLAVSPEDLQNKVYKYPPHNCTIRAKSNFLASIAYVTYMYSDPVQARIEFNKMKEGFASVSKVDEVPDVGDEAFWAGDKRFQRLVVKKGEAVIDILNPEDFDLQKNIALLVLDHLRSE